jgi:asparagine synthase (glutamine-hydrolysing)
MGVQRRMQYLDLKTWLVDDLLIKADRMTMGASVELRVPFLDYRLLEFSSRLPPRLRIKRGQPKYLMKKAAERYLPKDIIYRKKRGFPTPLADLFRNGMRSYVADTLGSRSFRERGLFKSDCVDSLLARHVSGDEDNHRSLWQLLVLENWYTTFIDPAALTPPLQGPA